MRIILLTLTLALSSQVFSAATEFDFTKYMSSLKETKCLYELSKKGDYKTPRNATIFYDKVIDVDATAAQEDQLPEDTEVFPNENGEIIYPELPPVMKAQNSVYHLIFDDSSIGMDILFGEWSQNDELIQIRLTSKRIFKIVKDETGAEYIEQEEVSIEPKVLTVEYRQTSEQEDGFFNENQKLLNFQNCNFKPIETETTQVEK